MQFHVASRGGGGGSLFTLASHREKLVPIMLKLLQ